MAATRAPGSCDEVLGRLAARARGPEARRLFREVLRASRGHPASELAVQVLGTIESIDWSHVEPEPPWAGDMEAVVKQARRLEKRGVRLSVSRLQHHFGLGYAKASWVARRLGQ